MIIEIGGDLMVKTALVCFKKNGKNYFFGCEGLDLQLHQDVIVETEKGLQYGQVIAFKDYDEQDLGTPLKNVIRVANAEDIKQHENNLEDAKKALNVARKKVEELGLNMKIIDSSFTFDRSQLLFNFLADERIDFRELAKKLAQIYHTRIELRQIGVRDKAKEIGGLGPCGLFLCCSTFLTNFNSVSINMAKNQMLALNPSKINGVCGRLLCCLKYEDDVYTDLKKDFPKIGSMYQNGDVSGKIVSLNVFKKTALVEVKNHMQVEVELNNGSTE